MRLGLLPALGGGLTDLAASGQASRLVDGYLRRYVDAFDDVTYFTYHPERLNDFTSDTKLLERVRVLAPERAIGRTARALTMPWRHASDFRACDVIRVFQMTGVLPALAVKARFGVPYVTTYGFWYRHLSRSRSRGLLKGALEHLGLRHAAAVIATTEDLRARAARLTRRVELIPNGVDLTRFRPLNGARRTDGALRILYVGRLSEEKNLSAIVAAACLLRDRVPIRLAMIGAGPLAAALRAETAARGIDLELPGIVDHTDLPARYAASDIFVLASFTEGHPKVLVEAMACGVPVVASSCPGNCAIVADGATGLLFDPARPADLAACLARLHGDPPLRERLAMNARRSVEAHYDLEVLVRREIDLLVRVGTG